MSAPTKFENHDITDNEAYRLICLFNTDEGGRNAVSARGWLKYSSWTSDERMYLTDGTYLFREPFVDGHLIHSNITTRDIHTEIFAMFTY